ncbi:MAG: efflux RND transporter periplasmic adaptor subunit [Candidatus Hydrogenedentota bacterium]
MNIPQMDRKKWAIIGGACAVMLFSVVLLRSVLARTPESGPTTTERVIFDARRGPLTISVNVSGTIQAREQEVIKCEVEGQTQILWIIEEGKQVKEGDLLIELDASSLVDQRVDQEIRVQNAEASFIGAREKLAVAKNQAQSDVDKAELDLQFAEEDLKNFVDGEFPKQLKEAEARITLAKGTAARARERVESSEKLAKEDFITPIELEADRQDLVKAELDLELAEDEKRLLTEFTYERKLTQLESDVHQARMALERIERKAAADVVQSEADLKAKESEYLRQKDKLEKIEVQIEKTKIYAPADGLVVYATSGRGGWRGNDEPLQEGQMVRERQELINLPTGSSFMAEVEVHETSLTKIRPGLPVRITVEAFPEKVYRGRVETVAPLPDARSAWLNPDLKVYKTDIVIEGDASGLRTGVTCLAEIIVEQYEDALYVPVQAVVREKGRPTVYLARGNTFEPQEVDVGLDNNRMIRILSGLEEGDPVVLNPPLAADKGDASETLEKGFAEEEQDAATSSDSSSKAAPVGGQPPSSETEERRDDPSGEKQDFEAMRERYRNASPEEREQMRKEIEKRMENMTPEQREQLRQQRGGRGTGRPAEGAPESS